MNMNKEELNCKEIMTIEEKRNYYSLLMEADPSIEMIEKYLSKSNVYVFEKEDKTIGIIVMLHLSESVCEIKNISVLPEEQKKGIGRSMIEHILHIYENKYKNIIVGTSDSGIGFYRKCGFRYSHIVKNFFIDNYSEPIIDRGSLCVDMIYFIK